MVYGLPPPLLHGMVVETHATSLTGRILYSDTAQHGRFRDGPTRQEHFPLLNQIARLPLIGRLAGITRIAIAIFHIIGHLFVAVITQNKGHLYHAAKGGCEALRGLIEAIPLIGDIFANVYGIPSSNHFRSWWMIKIYNPETPDLLDKIEKNWIAWKNNPFFLQGGYYIHLEMTQLERAMKQGIWYFGEIPFQIKSTLIQNQDPLLMERFMIKFIYERAAGVIDFSSRSPETNFLSYEIPGISILPNFRQAIQNLSNSMLSLPTSGDILSTENEWILNGWWQSDANGQYEDCPTKDKEGNHLDRLVMSSELATQYKDHPDVQQFFQILWTQAERNKAAQ